MLKFNLKILCLLALFLLFSVSVTYSIMRKTDNGNGTIIAADWDVSLNQTGIDNRLEVIPGLLNSSYTVKVNSHSEVDVVYNIIVSNIPNNVQVKLDNGTFQTPTSGTVTFSNAGNIAFSDSSREKTHTLTFGATSNAVPSANNSINIDVEIRQAL